MFLRLGRASAFVCLALLLGACSASDPRPMASAGGNGQGSRSDAAGDVGTASDAGAGSEPAGGASDAGASGASDGAAAGTTSSGAGGAAGADERASRAGTAGESGADAGGAGNSNAGGASTAGVSAGGANAGSGNAAGSAGDPNAGVMIPCAVNAVYSVCHACHSSPPVNGAPFPLVTLGQHQSYSSSELVVVSTGIMPLGGMLSDADKRTILDWLGDGAHGVPLAACP